MPGLSLSDLSYLLHSALFLVKSLKENVEPPKRYSLRFLSQNFALLNKS